MGNKNAIRTWFVVMQEYSLADLTKLTGAKRRTVQLWAEAGAIIADPGTDRAGTGTHRKFSRQEAIISLVIDPLARLHVSIGDLLKVASSVRRAFSGETDGRSWWADIERCVQGEISMNLIIANSASEARITVLTHETSETDETRWSRVGKTISETEKETGALGILIPLTPHLRVLR
jgi:hypothetical protein